MTQREILEAIIKSGREFTVSEYDGVSTISVFGSEEEEPCCRHCMEDEDMFYNDECKDEEDTKTYSFTLFTLPFGAAGKLRKYDNLRKKPTIEDYAVSFCASISTNATDGEEICEHIFQALSEDDELWFAPCTSDVIELSQGDGNSEFYYIDSVGFKKLPNFARIKVHFEED